MRPALLATLGAIALIFFIGCANVATLVLGQVDARSTEFAVRFALGAKRIGRISDITSVLGRPPRGSPPLPAPILSLSDTQIHKDAAASESERVAPLEDGPLAVLEDVLNDADHGC
jgi:hypothetical protein